MTKQVTGGQTSYGHIVGILMSDSTIPRIPGDPGHAQTFDFPVVYEVLDGFPFEDLIDIRKDHVDVLIEKAIRLQESGARIVATDCGLFSPFEQDVKPHLKVPFIGSSLDMVPLIQRFLPTDLQIGIITGDTRILSASHLEASGIDANSIVLSGMENSPEFNKVVIGGAQVLDVDRMRQGALDAALQLPVKDLGAVVLECTNLISFRKDIQSVLKKPVFDLVSLIEFYISGFRLKDFQSCFI